ncbi:hypothetical protein [Sutcliffiella halmapala]|uniref:hypothetical protein n=1 Tax=Sutcliffiella halmapala TaxID=79882 RepID=UPI0009957318|nr:hypothetical protein [Sutcliffiella halmapala]
MFYVLGTILSLSALIGFVFVWRFIKREGQDERGDQILGKAGMNGFFAFLLGYSIIFLLNTILQLDGQQYTFALTCLFALVVLSYSGSILVLRRQY